MGIKGHFFLLIFVFLSLNGAIKAQQTPEFFFGSYIASSSFGALLPDSLYQQIHNCGLNAAQLYAKKTYPTNLSKLSEFEYVYAANDSAPGHAKIPGNTDWINYFTHAKYYRWEAEGDENFPADQGTVGVKHEFGHSISQGWSTGQYYGQEIEPNRFIHGPHYTQYKYYTYVNRDIGVPIYYRAVFSVKMTEPTGKGTAVNIAQIRVELTNDSTGQIDTLASLILTTDTLTTDYQEFWLEYDYREYSSAKGDSMKYPSPIGSDWIPFGDTKSSSWIDFNLKVDFVVEWLGGTELDVDYIEVYDKPIWKNYVKYQDSLDYYISNYLDEFESANSTFYSKLKYFVTVDEPHTWDSFIPVRRVQETLDGLQSGKSLLVHYYPGWNNEREGVYDVLEKWVNIAQPKKLMFWYAPFVCDTSHVPYSRSFTLYQLHYILQQAHELQPDFFLTPQSFCKYNLSTSQYDDYMYPTTMELSAETMLGLAHGIKGINYEQYFSYDSNAPYRNYGLVDMPENNYAPLPLWYKVQELSSRIEGPLGHTLNSLHYSGDFLMLRRFVDPDEINTGDTVQANYLTLSAEIDKGLPYPINFHTGFFNHDENDKYFLLINMLTDSTFARWVNIKITDTSYTNIRVRNIEPEYDFDTTFTGNISFNYLFPEGEGYLFQVVPVVKYGGNLLFNETISSVDTLNGRLFIRANATLTINSTYTLNDTIVVDSGATLVINSSGVINCLSGTIINNGTLDINGGTLKFNQGLSLKNNRTMYADNALFTAYNQSWGSIICDGSATSNSIIDSCEVTHASDIQCLNSANVTIQNSLIQNCTEGIYIYNSEPNIIANQIIDPLHNGINAVSAGNEIEIYDNVIMKNNSNPQYKQYQGIFLQSYSQSYITHNDISGFCWGMYIGGGSSGYFVDNYEQTPVPNNRVDTCGVGIGVGWGSYSFGGCSEIGGYNTIMDNVNYDFKVYNYSTAWAEFNYWGGGEGNNYVDGTSELHDGFYLEEDPWKGSLRNVFAGIENPDKVSNNQLLKETGNHVILTGLELERNNQITEAINHYMQMVSSNTYPTFALTRLAVIKKKYAAGNIQNYLENLVNVNSPHKPVVLNLLAALSLNGNNYNQAITYYNLIIQAYPETHYAVNARFEKFFAALCYAKNGILAAQILSEIRALNLNDEEYLMRLESAADLLERFNNGSQNLVKSQRVVSEGNLPKEYGLYQNYPNPFNPVTTIRYDLPKDSKVSLVIYDITGREVRTIVSKEQKAGRYEVQFNGSSLASGVYFYRLQAGDYIKVQKMSLIK